MLDLNVPSLRFARNGSDMGEAYGASEVRLRIQTKAEVRWTDLIGGLAVGDQEQGTQPVRRAGAQHARLVQFWRVRVPVCWVGVAFRFVWR